MSAKPHPTYPNPTLVEAVCNVEFEGSQAGWQIARPGQFLKLVADEYPNLQAGPAMGLGVMLTQTGVAPKITAGPSQLRLTTEDGNRYVSIGDKHFAFGHTKPYPGWDSFRKQLRDGWEKFSFLTKPEAVTKIGLRYVNFIPRTAEHSLISDWLKATRSIPESLIASKDDPFMLRVESWLDEKSLLILTVGLAQAPDGIAPIIFDIDRIDSTPIGPEPEKVLAQIEQLHNDVWEEFSAAMTAAFEGHLKKRTT